MKNTTEIVRNNGKRLTLKNEEIHLTTVFFFINTFHNDYKHLQVVNTNSST